MLPRKTRTAGIALAVTLIAVPAVALAAKGASAQDDNLYEMARASASIAADTPLPASWTRSPATSASPASRPRRAW